jgi:hypothetical protein
MINLSRNSVSRLAKVMFGLFFLAFLYIAFQVAFSPRGYRVDSSDWQDVIPGTAQMVRRGSEYVWVVRYASVEAKSFAALNKVVIVGSTECDPMLHKACEFSGIASDGIVFRYLEQRPANLANNVPWFKGFIDPTSGFYFDRFGRLYRDQTNQQARLQGMKMLLGVRLSD